MSRERRILRPADRFVGRAPGGVASRERQPGERVASERASAPVLTLYRRSGCHLCEELEHTLFELVDPAGFVLERVNIDEHPATHARFDRDVPVLMHGDIELCRHFLDLDAVRQVLAGSGRLQ